MNVIVKLVTMTMIVGVLSMVFASVGLLAANYAIALMETNIKIINCTPALSIYLSPIKHMIALKFCITVLATIHADLYYN